MADMKHWTKWNDQDMMAAQNEIEILRAAIKPFVVAAADAEGYPSDHPIGCDPAMPLKGLTVGNLNDAKRAVEHLKNDLPVRA
jgi:hypothetical protein